MTDIARGLLLWAAAGTALASGGSGTLFATQVDVSSRPLLQEGARTFFNYCAGCHSLQYLRYSRMAEDLGLPEALVMKNLNTTGAKFGEPIMAAMPVDHGDNPGLATQWFGKSPPDLSLTARARGTDWVYSYLLSFYPDSARPMGWNNAQFPGASMPHVLWQLQGIQQAELHPKEPGPDGQGKPCEHGPELDGKCFHGFTPATGGTLSATQYADTIRALTSFLEYAGEPAILKREQYGVWVLLYLVLLSVLTYVLKHEFWKDVH